MYFKEVLEAMKQGHKVKLPSWGWLANQADMLADDWCFAKEV